MNAEMKLMQSSLNEYAEHMKEYEAALQRQKETIAALRARVEAAERERDELRDALRKLEYINFPYKMTAVKRCPVCGSPESDEFHSFDTDCWLAAALAAKGTK